jgi:nucleoside-diphosphate-sugar epimerase
LVTGAAGYIGQRVWRGLEKDYDLRLTDVNVPEGDARWLRLDITRPNDVATAMAGMDGVLHLAVASGHEGDHEDEEFNQLRFDVNVRGTRNVLEAARRAGVRRFVHTSSIMVVWDYPPSVFIAGDAVPRPLGTYAVTKQMAEDLCRYYASHFGLSIVCLRIAKPIDPQDSTWKNRRLRPQWLPFPDLIQAYHLALQAPKIGFEIITVVGEAARRRWDLSRAEAILGYRPTIRLEELGYAIGGEREPF